MSMYRLSQIEIDSVLLTDAQTRSEYFIKRVADWEEVWTLKTDNGFVLFGDDNHSEVIPLWPFQEFALLSCVSKWKNATPFSISLEQLLTKWLPGMAIDKRLIAVFPTPDDNALVMSTEAFGTLLNTAISEIE